MVHLDSQQVTATVTWYNRRHACEQRWNSCVWINAAWWTLEWVELFSKQDVMTACCEHPVHTFAEGMLCTPLDFSTVQLHASSGDCQCWVLKHAFKNWASHFYQETKHCPTFSTSSCKCHFSLKPNLHLLLTATPPPQKKLGRQRHIGIILSIHFTRQFSGEHSKNY